MSKIRRLKQALTNSIPLSRVEIKRYSRVEIPSGVTLLNQDPPKDLISKECRDMFKGGYTSGY